MKKASTIFVLLAVSATPLWAAARGVVAELFTSTSWGYCPYAEYAFERIATEQGLDKWVPVAWHVGGYFFTSEGSARGGYYAVSGIPQLWVDGIIQHRGAYTNNEQMYQWYMGTFNSRCVVSSPLTVTFLKNSYGSGKASVKVKVDLEENIASGHVCHIVLWETNLSYGGRNYAYVERALATKNVTVTNKGQSEEFSHEFTLQGTWKVADLGISVLVQNNSTKLMANGRGTKLASGLTVEPSSLGRVKALFN